MDTDVALITSIDLDHTDILGDTKEKIAREKIGIFRQNQIIVCADRYAPDIVRKTAINLNASFYWAGYNYNLMKIY